jgi:hypothetical protein
MISFFQVFSGIEKTGISTGLCYLFNYGWSSQATQPPGESPIYTLPVPRFEHYKSPGNSELRHIKLKKEPPSDSSPASYITSLHISRKPYLPGFICFITPLFYVFLPRFLRFPSILSRFLPYFLIT